MGVKAGQATADKAAYVALLLALAAAYVMSGRAGLLLAENQDNATLIWAPTGLSLAALVLGGRRLWPAVFAGALTVNLWIGTPLAASLGIATGNTLEAVVGAWLLTRIAGFDPAFNRMRDVLAFILFGAALCTVVSATCGVGSLLLGDDLSLAQAPVVWLDWWLGDAGGAIVVAPAILVWARGPVALRAMVRRLETWVVLALVALVAAAAFAGVLAMQWRLLAAMMVFPPLVWAGLRLGPKGAITASAQVWLIAVIGGSQGGGPFAGGANLYLTLAYIATTGMVAMIVAAAVAEREAVEALRRAGDDERNRLAQQARERQRLEELGVLAGGVAHDFNNLLVPILANADLLRRPGIRTAERDRRLDDISLSARRAAELCRQLLTYAGQTEPAREPVDLAQLTREMSRLLDASTAKRIVLGEFLDEGVMVRGDAAQLRQLVMNLILNASEACAEDGGTVRVRVAIERVSAAELARDQLAGDLPRGRYAVFEVVDDGVGMDPESVKRIFQPFYTTKFTGRGLGLAAVLGVVRAHGGAIVVDTVPGNGTSFRVFLPRYDGAAHRAAEPAPAARGLDGVALVADDEELVQRAIVNMLEDAGLAAIGAMDGHDAVEQFGRHHDSIDFVMLDVTMPRMDGKRALAAIREQHAEVPVILMSGYTVEKLGEVLDENTAFLPKPFTPAQLHTVVSDVLATRRSN